LIAFSACKLMLSPAYMEQQLSREFAKVRRTLTINPIIVPQTTLTQLKIQKSDYLTMHSES
jgi:hypothetical protein